MGYTLEKDCHFCVSGGRTIIMDVRKDAFYALPGIMEQAFSKARGNQVLDGGDILGLEQLCRSGLLRPCAAETELRPSQAAAPAVNIAIPSAAWTTKDIPFCATRLIAATRVLKRRGFAYAVDALCSLKSERAKRGQRRGADRLFEVLATFRLLSDFGGHYNRCLSRSYAVAYQLLKTGYNVDLIIGVATRPFSAHCWVQKGDAVLNDRVEVVRAYTPLLII